MTIQVSTRQLGEYDVPCPVCHGDGELLKKNLWGGEAVPCTCCFNGWVSLRYLYDVVQEGGEDLTPFRDWLKGHDEKRFYNEEAECNDNWREPMTDEERMWAEMDTIYDRMMDN